MTAGLVHIIDDSPEEIARLIEVAGTARFDHRVAEIRQKRALAQAYQEIAARYTDQGYTVIDEDQYPEYGDPTAIELRYLRTAEGSPATEEAITDPAHWAVYLTEEDGYVDNETGEAVDYHDIDWYSRHSGKIAEGKRNPNSVTEVTVWQADWVCTDYTAAGLTLCEQLSHRIEYEREVAERHDHDATGDDDPDQRAPSAAEAERRERCKVLALNKLGQAAAQVRREFITDKILHHLVDCTRRVSIGVGPAV